jgi:hypothetical protein
MLGFCLGHVSGQIVQHADLAFALHLDGGFLHGVQHAANAAVVTGNRAVGGREIRLLGHLAAADEQLPVFHPGGGMAFLDAAHQGARLIPHFGPGLRAGLRQRRGMLQPQDRAIRIVIQLQQFGSPPDHHGKPAAQHHAEHGLQAAGPTFDRPELGLGPVGGAHKCAHFALAGEQPGPSTRRYFRTHRMFHVKE